MSVLRWLLRGLAGLLALVVLYLGYASLAYRDIPAADIEARYGAGARIAQVDGVSLSYRLEGSGPPLVLIHSHYFDMGMWDAWVRLLALHYTVLRYDLTGHGLTGPDPSRIYTVERDVALLDGLVRQLQLGPAAVVGSSLGGNIAFTYAATQPQQVRALGLMNSGGLKRANSRSGKDIPAWAGHVMKRVPDAALRTFLRWMIADNRVIDDALATRFTQMFRRAGNREAEVQRLRQFEAGDPDGLLARITAPTLIQWGERNPQLPVALAQQFEQKLTSSPRVVRKVYPGAGHVLPLEVPEESARDLIQFLDSSVPDATAHLSLEGEVAPQARVRVAALAASDHPHPALRATLSLKGEGTTPKPSP